MRDLAFLTQPHEPSEAPGLDSTDEQLASISELVDEGDFAKAADRVEDLVRQDVYDVRLLVFLFYAAFLEEGFGKLAAALEGFETFLEHSREALGPAERKEAQIARSLRWLLEHVADTAQYEEKKGTARWKRMAEELDAELATRMREAVRKLVDIAGEPTLKATTEAHARLTRWLRDVGERAAAAADKEPEMSEEKVPDAPAPASAPASGPKVSGTDLGAQVHGSAKLVELLRKLEAFERLVGRRSFEKAALVSDDVLHLIENFDPREYFPDLFSEFGALLSSHVEEITPHWEHKDSVRWRMLEQFYKVDLGRFEEER